MKLVTYRVFNFCSVGVINYSGDIVDIHSGFAAAMRDEGRSNWKVLAEKDAPRDMVSLLEAGEKGIDATRIALEFAKDTTRAEREGIIIPIKMATLLAPVLTPPKITCVGRNYKDHAAEAGKAVPDFPEYFSSYNTSINHPHSPVMIPADSEQVDWEAELAVVIGRSGRNISEEEAMDYIAGYTIVNDVSVRDYQRRTSQWMAGKTFDGHAPMGPYLVLKEGVPDPHDLDITLKVNGEVMQHANTRDMVYKIPQLISDMSKIWTIEPGDIIATGTMAGVGVAMKPPRFLKSGDIVSIDIERLGVLENEFLKAIAK